MSYRIFLPVLLLLSVSLLCQGQTLTVSYVGEPDTAGLSSTELGVLEKSVSLNLPSISSGDDTLVVQLGPSIGMYDLFERRFPLGQTGVFNDGCSLDFSSGANVGLGSFTGISTFHVRAYLSSSGVGSAITVDNN
jgi:hypothetical protein